MDYFSVLLEQNWELGAIKRRLRQWARGQGALPVVTAYSGALAPVAIPRADRIRKPQEDETPPVQPDASTDEADGNQGPESGSEAATRQGGAASQSKEGAPGRTDDNGEEGMDPPAAVQPYVPLGRYQPLAPQVIRDMGAVAIARRYEALTRGIYQSEQLAEEMAATRERAKSDRRLLGWRQDLLRARDLQAQRQGLGNDQEQWGMSARQRHLRLALDVARGLDYVEEQAKGEEPLCSIRGGFESKGDWPPDKQDRPEQNDTGGGTKPDVEEDWG